MERMKMDLFDYESIVSVGKSTLIFIIPMGSSTYCISKTFTFGVGGELRGLTPRRGGAGCPDGL